MKNIKIKKKSLIKLILGSLVLLPASFAVVACGTKIENNYNIPTGLRGQGSSSVLPIIEEVKPIATDLQYEATGSGDGFKVGLGDISKDFGMTSSLKKPTNDAEVQKWTSNKTRTITFQRDAIGVAINLPTSITGISVSNRPIINGVALGRLFDQDTTNDNVTWSDLLENPEADNNTDIVFAFGRTGGAKASGTSDGFFSSLTVVSGLTKAQMDIDHLKLGSDHMTAEANSAAKVAVEQKKGSLTYLSLGYSLQNENNNLILASIKTNSNQTWVPSIENVNQGSYKWSRPFNIVYNVTNAKALSFTQFLLGDDAQQAFTNIGFFAVTTDERAKQIANVSKSDVEVNGALSLLDNNAIYGLGH